MPGRNAMSSISIASAYFVDKRLPDRRLSSSCKSVQERQPLVGISYSLSSVATFSSRSLSCFNRVDDIFFYFAHIIVSRKDRRKAYRFWLFCTVGRFFLRNYLYALCRRIRSLVDTDRADIQPRIQHASAIVKRVICNINLRLMKIPSSLQYSNSSAVVCFPRRSGSEN